MTRKNYGGNLLWQSSLTLLALTIKNNVDYMTKCEVDDWPRDNDAWHHSDLKNVAYYFTYKLYEKISNNE